MLPENKRERNILIQITKVDQIIRGLTFIKDFSVNKFKKLYQKGKDFIKFLSDTKKILILSQFTMKDSLAFTEIQQDLNISSSLLSYNLKKMTDLGFLKKINRKERRKMKFSYYRVTELGKKVLAQIFFLGHQ
ncbi:MAG: winged helix-turn-helix transcriptional regulator [Candidatus Helarchaeota archaeon]|nr:winged helix-turn-helix transcriptional regulator [Candidatus Helarchaeota archaeon]